MTEVKVPGDKKKLYLSAILDLYDRYPVSCVVSCRNNNKPAFKTFDKAIAANPDANPVFYSDRRFQRKLKEQEMQQSMSRLGHCIDNGPIECFWSIVKSKMYQMYEITDEASLRYTIRDYMRFYSEERPQDRYHCKTPLEVERKRWRQRNRKNISFPKTNEMLFQISMHLDTYSLLLFLNRFLIKNLNSSTLLEALHILLHSRLNL